MANSIEYTKRYTSILDEVYQRASVSGVLTSPRHMIREGRNVREILIPRIEVSGLGNYERNVGYATGAIEYSFESHVPDYDRGLKLVADVLDVEEAGALNCFVAAGAELQRTQVAPEADAYTFSKIAGFEGVTVKDEDLSAATAEDILKALRDVTNEMDESQVDTGSRYLFITPTLNGVVSDFSYANPNRSNRVLERFARIIEVPQVRFYTAIDLLSGGDDGFGYRKAAGTYALTEDTEVDSSKTYYTESGGEYTAVSSPTKSGLSGYYELSGVGRDINFMVVEKSAVLKWDRHIASRVFAPDELESLDSYMMKYRKAALTSVLSNKTAGVYVSADAE